MLLTMPVPYGWTSLNNTETGYNVLGVLSFTSATAATFNGSIINPRYRSDNSPIINSADTIYFRNTPVTIEAMNATTGFVGGYKLTFAYSNSFSFNVNAIPANNSKTILMQSSGGIEPASGVCQL